MYKYGFIGPTTREAMIEDTTPRGTGPGTHSEPLLPPDVVRVGTGIGISDYTTEGVEEAIRRYWGCVDEVIKEGAQRTFLAGFPISAQLGRARALQLFDETSQKTGLPASSDAEATIESIKHLGVSRLTIASRWADDLNRKLAGYLGDAGIEVLHVTSANQWVRDAHAMSIDQGVKLSFQLGKQALRNAPNAQGLLIPGGSWRPLAAIAVLEEEHGVPVFSNPTAIPWRLIHDGLAAAVQGWGRLLATP